MNWKPIVAGVDLSDEGIRSARTAVEFARAAGTDCYLVHATRDPATQLVAPEVPFDFAGLREAILASARARVTNFLRRHVPGPVLERLVCGFGPPALVVGETAEQKDADLIVLGGKHHAALGRWLAGSTVHQMVRMHDRPILVAGPARHREGNFERVLLGVDLSPAARLTICAGERIAGLFDANLCVMHVVEPVPWIELAPLTEAELQRRSEEELNRSVWPEVRFPRAERVVRRGSATEALAEAAAAWSADLLVVGSHGRGWVERMLVGSVTERLLNLLPTSMLVVPVPGPAAPKKPRVAEVLAGART